jgi:hypothetical protein
MHFPRKWCCIEKPIWYIKKELLKSFPMNDHVSMFRQSSARFLEPLIIFRGRGKVRGAIALLKRDALVLCSRLDATMGGEFRLRSCLDW